MAMRMNNSTMMLFGIVLILAVGGLVFLASGGKIGAGAVTIPSEQVITNQGLTGTEDGIVTCTNVAPQAKLAAFYVDTSSSDQNTQVATNAYICTPGASSCVAKTTATSGFNTTSVGDVGCLDTVDFIAGDQGTTYYYGHSGAAKITSQTITPGGPNGLKVIKSGAATFKLADTSAASYGWNTTLPAFNWTLTGAGAGGESQNVIVRITAPSKPSVFGDLGYALCTKFNSNNFTSVMPANSNGLVSQPLAHVKATSTLDTVQCYDMGKLESGAVVEVPLYIKAKASVTPSTATTIGLTLVDYTSCLYNGELIPSYESRNGTAADIAQADVTQAAAVTLTN